MNGQRKEKEGKMGKNVTAKCIVGADVHRLLYCTVRICAVRCFGKREEGHVV